MAKHLVLAGAGHAHMTTLVKLGRFVAKGHKVTVVSPSRYHYYSGMGPGILGGTYAPEEARFAVGRMSESRGAAFVEDSVTRIDPENRVLYLASGGEIRYDVASFNTGSDVSLSALAAPNERNVFAVKPITNLVAARDRILAQLPREQPLRILVVGGGPAGVEVAANAWHLAETGGGRAEVTLVAGSRLLPTFPERARRLARKSFARRGITVVEGRSVKHLKSGTASLDNAREVPYDFAFVATGITPSRIFADSGMATGPGGGLLVDSYLRSVRCGEVFGGGDCVSVDGLALARVGVYAVRQNGVLFHNLMAALTGGELRSFDPGGAYALILNMGDSSGILAKWGLTIGGKLVFRLKDRIDRRFMRRFQVSGESAEGV